MANMFRKLYYLTFGGLPKYIIIKYGGNYFPMKKNITGYLYMIDHGFSSTEWESESHVQAVCFNYPGLHAYHSLRRAKEIIERTDDVNLKEVNWDPPKYYSSSDKEYFFEPSENKEFVKKKDGGTSQKEDSVITA